MNEGIENAKKFDVYNLEEMSKLSSADTIKAVEGNELLSEDGYTRTVMENDFVVTVRGETKELNPGTFACLRLAFLEQMRSSHTLEQGKKHPNELESAMVVHSSDRVVDEDGPIDQ